MPLGQDLQVEAGVVAASEGQLHPFAERHPRRQELGGNIVEAKIGLVPVQEPVIVAPHGNAIGHPRQRIAEHGHGLGRAFRKAPALCSAGHSFPAPPLG